MKQHPHTKHGYISYEHGADLLNFKTYANCSLDQIIDFSSSINCSKPNITKPFNYQDIYNYPDINYTLLKKAITSYFNIDTHFDIELFNGASSAIYSFVKHSTHESSIAKTYLYAPLYLEYIKITSQLNIKTTLINRLTSLKTNVEAGSLVIFVNPSTPDGKLYDINELMLYWISLKCTILIDESFLDFTTKTSVLQSYAHYNCIYVLKSLTKFFGCAGVRIGFIISNKKNINNISYLEPPWKLSAFDIYYIMQCLNDDNFKYKSFETNERNKALLNNILENSRLFEHIYPSNANFILAKLQKYNAYHIQKLLYPYHIYIRNCFNFDFLDDTFIRLAVKDKASINILKDALEAIKKGFIKKDL